MRKLEMLQRYTSRLIVNLSNYVRQRVLDLYPNIYVNYSACSGQIN